MEKRRYLDKRSKFEKIRKQFAKKRVLKCFITYLSIATNKENAQKRRKLSVENLRIFFGFSA